MRSQLRFVTALLLLSMGFACATVQREAANTLISTDDEIKLGQQVRAEVLKQSKELNDPQVQAYVQSVGNKIVALYADRLPKGIQPKFTVLDDDQVNAFAIPGGDIFVLSGLLRAVKNEAELASVLSHEMGHVIERHAAQGLVAQMGAQTLASILLGKNPSQLAQIGASVAANGYLIRNTQGFERQADRDGMQTMIKSDWDPHQMIAFFDQLAKESGSVSGIEAFLSSHPPPADRAQYLGQQLAAAGNKSGAVNPEPIASIQQRLPPPKKVAGQPPPHG